MVKHKETVIGEVGVVRIDQLPGRKIGKGAVLASLPQVREMIDKARSGLGAGEAIYLKLDKTKMSELKITTPGRILKEIFETMVREEKLTAKSGNKLDVKRYTDDTDGEEVVVIQDAVDLYKRTSSDKRTKLRQSGGK
jgi:hypothetical protein